jgi:hypothetical protein
MRLPTVRDHSRYVPEAICIDGLGISTDVPRNRLWGRGMDRMDWMDWMDWMDADADARDGMNRTDGMNGHGREGRTDG